MYRQSRDALFVEERDFDAVPVVGVQVDVVDLLYAGVEKRRDREHRVVEIAEAAGAVGASVVCAPGRVKHGMSVERQFGSKDGTTDCPRRTIIDSLEQRILQGTDLVEITNFALDPAAGVGVLQRLDVGAIVKLEQSFDTGRLACAKIVVRQPAQNPGEVHDGRMADDLERVIVAKRGSSKGLAADEYR